MEFTYKTKGVCSQMITFNVEDNKVSNVKFFGGCNGNLKASLLWLRAATSTMSSHASKAPPAA